MIKKIINKKIIKIKNYDFLFLKFFIIIIYIYLNALILNKKIRHKIQVCICSIGKKENLYIREYIEYYKNLGVDKIYIYDNNEINGEAFETVIYDYIKINYVNIINYRGYHRPQRKMMNNCYKMNYLKYDWLIFIDLDEFLYLKNYSNIKNFLNEPKFNNCKKIYLNYVFYTDNNNVYYENKTLMERFKETFLYKVYWGKTIIRGNISGINITSVHYITGKVPACNGFGKKSKQFNLDSKYYYFKHYSFKSTEELCNKLNRGNADFENSYQKKINKIYMYFTYNKITIQKIEIIENKTGIKLDNLRNKLKNKKYKITKKLF